VHTPEGLLRVLTPVIGDAEARKAVGSAEAKAALVKATDEAMAKGAFGMPYFVATDAHGREEAFWGFDHLGQVVAHLGFEREVLGGAGRAML